jgi:hypothetical protein
VEEMNVRELLRYEIWSKRTTRKILVWSGTFLGFVVALLTIWILVERHWLTPGERRAGKAALAQVGELENFESMSAQDFDAKSYRAQILINDADKSAWTWRDRAVVESLGYYYDLLKIDQEERQRDTLLEQRFPGRFPRDPKMDSVRTAEDEKSRALLRRGLQRILE